MLIGKEKWRDIDANKTKWERYMEGGWVTEGQERPKRKRERDKERVRDG